MTRLRWREVENAVGDREVSSGRNDIEVIGFDQEPFRSLLYLH